VVALVPSRDAGKSWSEPQITKRPRLSQRMRRAPIIQTLVWYLIAGFSFAGLFSLMGCSTTNGQPNFYCFLGYSLVVFMLLCVLTPLLQWFVFLCFCTSEASVRAFRIVFALNFLPLAWLLLAAAIIYIFRS
jgi:hypothetical protein